MSKETRRRRVEANVAEAAREDSITEAEHWKRLWEQTSLGVFALKEQIADLQKAGHQSLQALADVTAENERLRYELSVVDYPGKRELQEQIADLRLENQRLKDHQGGCGACD